MKKRIIINVTILSIIAIVFFMITKIIEKNNNRIDNKKISEIIYDECTDEYQELKNEKSKTANTSDEKISPNAKMYLKKIYKKCNHIIEDEIELPIEMVNKDINEIQNEYNQWEIEEFSAEKIVLSKKYEGECGEHYILRDNDGVIAIYTIDENRNESLLDETEIATEYLPESDLINIKDGLIVNGRKNLNKILEDFE